MDAPRIESLLSARLFQAAQSVGDRIIFASNLSGKVSLYAMDHGGSVDARSQPGRTVFAITLPISPAAATHA